MKILITCDHFAVASGRYAYDALKRMGHDVKSQGLSHGNLIWGKEIDPQYAWVPDVPEADWKPDLVIHMDPNRKPIRVGNALHVVYGVDNHVRDYWPDFGWDHLFLVHKFGNRIGEENVTWLPCGYDPVYFDGGPKLESRTLDAAMIAYMYDNRASSIYALRHHLPQLTIAYDTGPVYDEFAAIYRNAKISLVRSFGKDVAIRVWETAAMGCLLIMDWCHDAEELGLEHGKNCLVYQTDEELVQRVKWVMMNPDDAQKIANAGKRWARPHTWDARLQVIVDWAAGQGKRKQIVPTEKPEGSTGVTRVDEIKRRRDNAKVESGPDGSDS